MPQPPSPPQWLRDLLERSNRLSIWIVLGAFALMGVVYAIIVPIFEVSDELSHYPMVKTLADGHGLPVQDPANVGPWRQEGSQPPLYYALMAGATFWIDTDDLSELRWINPHADNGVVTGDRNSNLVVHHSSEWQRWQGTALAVRFIRFLSVLLGTGTVYFAYRLSKELMPQREALALMAAGVAAFTPMFVFISASVNNDNLAVFLSTLSLWMLARWLNQAPPKVGWSHVALGLLLGAGALTKQSALGLAPLAGLVLLFVHVRASRLTPNAGASLWRALGTVALQSLVVFGIAGLVAFWWYWRNWQLYGDWLGWNMFVKIAGARAHPATLLQIWGERESFIRAYWGLFGGVNVPMPEWAYLLLNSAAVIAVLGWAVSAVRGIRRRQIALTDVARWALPILWIVLILYGLTRWTSITLASQGRLVFPAIAAISLLVAVGLWHIWRGLPGMLVGCMALLTVMMPFTVIAPQYTPPPEPSAEQMAAIPHRLDVDFGGEMKLLGYDLRTTAALPGQSIRLTLYWQSLIRMDRNWSVFLHLVDQDDILVAQRDRYPGQGLLATTLMQPGQTFADEYIVHVPVTAYAPGRLQFRVGLYDFQDGVRLSNNLTGDFVAFGSIALQRGGDLGVNLIQQNFDNQMELTGYDVQPRVARPGDSLLVSLTWKALAPIRSNYSVSVRVRDVYANKWAVQDSWPRQGAAPTSAWEIGKVVTDSYTLILDPTTPPGQYDVEVVVYEATTLRSLQLVTTDGRILDADSVRLSPIRVAP